MYRLVFMLLTFTFCLGSCTSPKNVEQWTIASEMGDCVGVAPMKCLLIKKGVEQNWEYFYTQIRDFEYEPGYEYEIEVKKETVESPVSDQSSINYTLVKIISKTAKASEGLPQKRE